MTHVKGGRLGALLLVLLLVLAGSSACSRGEGADDDASSETADSERRGGQRGDSDAEDDENGEEAVPIEVVELSRGKIESVLKFSTNLEAESEVQVFSEAARRVRQLLVEEGSEVVRGQVLIRLQDDEQRTALARAESQLKKAQREYERQTSLFEQQLISEETFNDATYNLEQLELSLRDAQRQLGYTQVRAPIAGTVTSRLVNVGDQITVNQHLFDIVDFDSIVARIYVPEKDLYRIKSGLEARIFAQAAGDDEPRTGTVDRIAPRVDPRSGTVKVTVKIPRNQALLPGMYVTVELITAVDLDALLVPKKALVYDADQIFVFRPKTVTNEEGEDEMRVERLLLTPVLEDRDNIEPAGVVEEGDQIVIAGQAGLKEGSLVRLVGADSEETAVPADEESVAAAD